MRYEFVGRKSNLVGKPLWEIVGNLKNFGVGRLIKPSITNEKGLNFMKIVKVQPLPPSKKEFEPRKVLVWVDEIFNDRRRVPGTLVASSDRAKFQLIPKIEEEEYLKRAETLTTPVKYIKKYCFCPPLYKRLWEQDSPTGEQMPKIKTVTSSYEAEYEVILLDEELQPSTCSLYREHMTVDEMYKEIVRLKKIINSNKIVQE